MNALEAFLLTFIFHLVYLYSVFDIHFRSPLVQSPHSFSYVSSYHVSDIQDLLLKDPKKYTLNNIDIEEPPAKRIVIFVVEGLEAHSFFENQLPFLNIKNRNASWGISHSQAPTETRPCHVAMIGGFYEDVSAITTAWKANPVKFDSVFHQALYTAEIGSPSIVNNISGDNIYRFYSNYEDLGPKMIGKQDRSGNYPQETNVNTNDLPRIIEQLLGQSEFRTNISLEQTILFIHLEETSLQLTDSGNRPSNKELFRKIDETVEHCFLALEQFFNDNKTAYIFTGAHGVNRNGSSGDNSPLCTRTPFLAWGAGIRPESIGESLIIEDGSLYREEEENLCLEWGLNYLNRKDLHQIDIAPLVSSLIGISLPKNNLGTVPLCYLDKSDSYRSRNLFANTLQIFSQYIMKEKEVKLAKRLNFKPFKELKYFNRLIMEISSLINENHFQKADKRSLLLIDLALKGLKYYQDYDNTMLHIIITVGYLSWMGLTLIYVIKHYSLYGRRFSQVQPQFFKRKGLQNGSSSMATGIFAGIVQLCFSTYLVMQSSPILYHLYILFPVFFTCSILLELPVTISFVYAVDAIGHLKFEGFFNVLALEVIVLGYFMREIFSAVLLCIGILPVLLNIAPSLKPRLIWLFACISLSLFTMLPTEYDVDTRLILLGGIMLFLAEITWSFIYQLFGEIRESLFQTLLYIFQTILILFTTALVSISEWNRLSNTPLPKIYIYLNWLLLISAPMMALFSSNDYRTRLQSTILSYSIPFILLSEGYEILFFMCFSVMLKYWTNCEVRMRMQRNTSILIYQEDLSSAIFFIFLLHVSLFGTNSVSSIGNSDIDSLHRFGEMPYFMSVILIVLKHLIAPFLLTISYMLVLEVTRTPKMGILILILTMFDILTLNFYFMVTNVGSWKEISTSIVRFAIGNLFPTISVILFTFAIIYTHNIAKKKSRSRKS